MCVSYLGTRFCTAVCTREREREPERERAWVRRWACTDTHVDVCKCTSARLSAQGAVKLAVFLSMTNPCVGVLLRRFPLATNHSWLARPPAAAFSRAEALELRSMGMHLRIGQRQEAV